MKKILYSSLFAVAMLGIYSMEANYWSFAEQNKQVGNGAAVVEDDSTATQANIDKIHSQATRLSNKLASSTELSAKTYKAIQKHLAIARLELKRATELVKKANA